MSLLMSVLIATAFARGAEIPTVTFQAAADLPHARTLYGSIALEWENASAEIDWALGSFGVPDLALSSSLRFGDVRLDGRIDEILATPMLTAELGIRSGSAIAEVSSSWRLAERLVFDRSSLSLGLGSDGTASIAGRVRVAASGVSAVVDARAHTRAGDVSLQREWLSSRDRRIAYTLDLPVVGLGVTYATVEGESGLSSETSWHAVTDERTAAALSGRDVEGSYGGAAPAAATPTLEPPSCQACNVIHPTADSDDRTIGFGEAMVGDQTENALILNCPYHVFCWLGSVTDAPSAPFSITYAPIGMTIPIGSERRLELAFAPTSPGEYRDSLTIRYCVAYWVDEEDEVLADVVDHVTGYYTYRCSSYTFPLAGTALAKPEARASYTPESPICGKEVTFDASASFDPNPEGAIVSYNWDFGDGTTSSLMRPTHRFSSAGAYEVRLTVQNNREMTSDPLAIAVDVAPDYLETAVALGGAAAAGWATHTSGLAAPLLAAAVPGAALAVSSIIAEAGAARFPIDQLVVRFPETWDPQDVEELLLLHIPGAEVLGFFSTLGAFLVRLPVSTESVEAAEVELETARETLQKILPPGTRLAKNYIGRFEGSAYTAFGTDVESLDAVFRIAYDAVRAPEAWRRLAASDVALRPVRVAVIDTGIDATHEEFTIPLRGRSYVVEQAGSQPWYEDATGHGTQIAGIIAAENGRGRTNGMLAGCVGQYEMQMYRVIGDMFSVWDSLRIAVSRAEEELDALSTAVAAGARRKSVVVNISLGWDLDAFPETERVLARNTFLDLFERYPETLFVSSAGNGDRPLDLPASAGKPIGVGSTLHAPGGLTAANNLTVAATNAAGTDLMSWSNYGPAVDIAAPGCDVYTTKTDGEYTWRVEGSSYAAGMVSGAAATVRSIDPKLSPAEVKEILMSSPSRVRSPDGRLIPVLDFADAVEKAMDGRIERNRRTLWWVAGSAAAALAAGLLLLRPF
jgi:subtilisin family serine protease